MGNPMARDRLESTNKMGEPMGELQARAGLKAPKRENRWENHQPGPVEKQQNGRTKGRTKGGPGWKHQNGRSEQIFRPFLEARPG